MTAQLKQWNVFSTNTCESWLKLFLIEDIAGKSEFVTWGNHCSLLLVTATFATNRKTGVQHDAFSCLTLVEV